VSKIVFQYGKSHSSWGEPGVYGKGETIEICPVNNNSFKITKHILVTHSAGVNESQYAHDTTVINTDGYSLISKGKIERLFAALNTNKDNFNISYVKPYLKKLSKKQILKIVKNVDVDSIFDGEFDNKDERNGTISRIQNLYKLDSFLNLNKPSHSMSITMDVYDGLRMYWINKTDTIKCNSTLFDTLLGQPFEYDEKRVINGKVIVNLEINTILSDILPKSSWLRENYDLSNLNKAYIKWYLKKVL
ncbi:MAG: hypothetical protein ABI203_01250, partial [Mucilaginibacter sp.]